MSTPELWEYRYNVESSTYLEMQSLLLTLDSTELVPYLEKVRDRLDNDGDERLARIGLSVLAPVASRLNRQQLKHEIENLSFAIAKPNEYKLAKKLLQQHKADRKQSVAKLCDNLKQTLKANKVEDFTVDGRTKQPYSLYKKLHKTGTIGDIHDLLAIRVVVADIATCYRVLDIIHESFEPVLERFKDYIEQPKPNGYRSLHTTVCRGHKTIEVQIRTKAMHDQAESGEAAHWHYDQQKESKQYKRGQAIDGMLENSESQAVYVFSPSGDVYALAGGSTPIDFAFAVHTQVGLCAKGAKIDGSIVKLNTKLSSGDLVEIDTSQQPHPKRDWLGVVATRKARSRIKSWLKELESERYTDLGKGMLFDIWDGREGLDIDDIAASFKFDSREKLYRAIGENVVNLESIRQYIKSQNPTPKDESLSKYQVDDSSSGSLVIIGGVSGLQYKIGRCCNPRPGQPVVGFITRSLGITIHMQGCASLQAEDERLIEAEWK